MAHQFIHLVSFHLSITLTKILPTECRKEVSKNYIAIEQRLKILGKASDGSILPQFSRVVNSRILVVKVEQSRIIFSFCLEEPRCSQHQTSDHFSFKDGILRSVSLIPFR